MNEEEDMKREHLYVSRKHPCLWLMVLCMAASAILRILQGSGIVWVGVIAALMYVLITLFSGEEMLYRTAVPVWMMGLCIAILSGGVLIWVACLLFCLGYSRIICGKMKKIWILPLCLLALVGSIYTGSISDCLFVIGMLLLWPAIKVHNDGKWHPTWGDRIDGRRVRTAQVMEQITAYFMPSRTGANNLFSESVEITELERYIRRKRKEGMSGFSMTHAVLAAYIRTVAKYPA